MPYQTLFLLYKYDKIILEKNSKSNFHLRTFDSMFLNLCILNS